MATIDSGELPDACNSVLGELRNRIRAAEQKWVAAQAATALALDHERVALDGLHAARTSFDEVHSSLSRVYGPDKMPAGPQLPGTASASGITGDVLSEIFKHMAESHTSDKYDSTVPPAFIVAAVSRHWRRAALATPSIWTKLRLSFSPKMWTFMKEYLAIIIARSRQVPLDLYFCDMDPVHQWKPSDEDAITKALSLSWRVQVYISDFSVSFRNSVLHQMQAEMPAMREIRFITTDDLELRNLPQGIRLLTLCPNLEVLDLGALPFHAIDPPAMPRISSFAIAGRVTSDQFFTMQTTWPNLRRLELAVVSGMPRNSNAAKVFLRLEDLKMKYTGSVLRIIDHAQAPVLRDLTLPCVAETICSDFSAFIRPGLACTSLRSLRLTGKYASLFPNIFASLPNLATLVVTKMEAKPTRDFFRLWMADPLSHTQPPQLQQLHLENCGFGSGARDLLILFVTRRHGSARSLQNLRIVQNGFFTDGDDIFPEWMASRLRQLAKDVTIDTAKAVEMLEEE